MTADIYNYPSNYANFSSAVDIFATSVCILNQCFRESDFIEANSIFDVIIVGAGTAGCVLANRLSEDPNVKVLLIEAGGNPPLASFVPGLSGQLYGSEYDWNFKTVDDKYASQCLQSPALSISRGKMLGGTSSLNGMLWTRGSYHVYDDWANLGNEGWDSETMIKYFKKSENARDAAVFDAPYGEYYRGNNGPVNVDRYVYDEYSDKTFSTIFSEFGLNYSADLNGKYQIGYGWLENNIYEGIRQSSAVSYLQPAQYRDNLFVLKKSLVTKLLIDPSTYSVNGVTIQTPYGLINVYRDDNCGEVILSAGTINTPQILQLSGIGPRSELEKLGIKVVKDLPVGYNYQDHSAAYMHIEVNDYDRPQTQSTSNEYSEYFSCLGGPLAGSSFSGIVAVYDENGDSKPDFQIISRVKTGNTSGTCAGYQYDDQLCSQIVSINKKTDMIDLLFEFVDPQSRGKVVVQSTDPTKQPLIYNGYGSNTTDLKIIGDTYLTWSNVTNTPILKEYSASVVYLNSSHCSAYATGSADYWGCYHLCTSTSPSHAVGTAKMGPSCDKTAVVDNKLKVYGMHNLRIVDASIMPTVSSGNTNCPVTAIAERAADIIKDDRASCLQCN